MNKSAFIDVPPNDFPFDVEVLDVETRKVVWRVTVTGPGAVEFPGRDQTNNGKPVAVRVSYPDGTINELDP